ncbi:hypothetical protein [Rhizobium sp. 21-4511-3d]
MELAAEEIRIKRTRPAGMRLEEQIGDQPGSDAEAEEGYPKPLYRHPIAKTRRVSRNQQRNHDRRGRQIGQRIEKPPKGRDPGNLAEREISALRHRGSVHTERRTEETLRNPDIDHRPCMEYRQQQKPERRQNEEGIEIGPLAGDSM